MIKVAGLKSGKMQLVLKSVVLKNLDIRMLII